MNEDKIRDWADSIEALGRSLKLIMASDDFDKYEVREKCFKIQLYLERIDEDIKNGGNQ